MYRYLSLTLLLLTTSLLLKSQYSKNSHVNSSYSADTALIHQQIKKAFVFAQNPASIDSADYYLNKLYSLSRRNNYDKGIIEYFRIKAITYFIQQKEDSVSHAIEKALFISPLTVDSHRKNLLTKLNVNNTASLIRVAAQNGWI